MKRLAGRPVETVCAGGRPAAGWGTGLRAGVTGTKHVLTAYPATDYWLWGLQHGFTEDPLRCRRLVTALLQ